VVKSHLPMLIVGWRSDGRGSFLGLVLFKVGCPSSLAWSGGAISWYRVYGSPVICHCRELIVSRILVITGGPRYPGYLPRQVYYNMAPIKLRINILGFLGITKIGDLTLMKVDFQSRKVLKRA
jgi:hypothetical protein